MEQFTKKMLSKTKKHPPAAAADDNDRDGDGDEYGGGTRIRGRPVAVGTNNPDHAPRAVKMPQ